MEFELEIDPAGESYLAMVRGSPLGRQSRRARYTFNLPVLGGLNGGGPDPRHLAVDGSGPAEASARELGRRLFESVFKGPVLAAWRASLAMEPSALTLRLLLADDARLLSIPWELLFDDAEGEFIAIQRCLLRSLDPPSAARRLKRRTRLRVLVILSCPPGVPPLQIEEEWAVLQEALNGVAQLQRVPPRLDEVDRALHSGRWDVLHFAGHGEVDEEGSYLLLEELHGDSWAVDFLRLQTVLAHPSLQLVVLNACGGGRPGSADAFSGVAQALVRRGVPAVVAMQEPVADRDAIAFSRSFYRALAERATVGEQLRKARRALFHQQGAAWAVPVVYLNGPDGALVKGRIWRMIAAILGVALAVLGLVYWWWLHPPLTPPRGAEKNSQECPSPPGLAMAFVKIAPGTFMMGEAGTKETEPVHQVTITRPFCIGVYEVTQEQWARVLKIPPPSPKERYLPISDVKYEAAQGFIRLLMESDPAHLYRLPTEAEWEYVARGKTPMRYSFMDRPTDLVRYANCRGIADRFEKLAWVGQFPANLLGVHDMYGNVFEWVENWYGEYPGARQIDPRGPAEGTRRVRRGGSWDSGPDACSSAARSVVKGDRKDQENGFRIVREIR